MITLFTAFLLLSLGVFWAYRGNNDMVSNGQNLALSLSAMAKEIFPASSFAQVLAEGEVWTYGPQYFVLNAPSEASWPEILGTSEGLATALSKSPNWPLEPFLEKRRITEGCYALKSFKKLESVKV